METVHLKPILKIAVLMMMSGALSLAEAQTPTLQDQICGLGLPVEVAAGGINLRAETTTSSTVVGQTAAGQTLIVIGSTANGQAVNGDSRWLNIEDIDGDGESDWVLGNLILPSSQVAEIVTIECTAANLLPVTPMPATDYDPDSIDPNTLPVISDNGNEYSWASVAMPEQILRIKRSVQSQQRLVQQAFGLGSVGIFAFDNGRTGNSTETQAGFQWGVIPVITDTDGNLNLFWSYENETGFLNYNPALPPFQAGRAGFAQIKIPAGLGARMGFDSAGSRPYLFITGPDGENLASLNTFRPVIDRNPAALFEPLGDGNQDVLRLLFDTNESPFNTRPIEFSQTAQGINFDNRNEYAGPEYGLTLDAVAHLNLNEPLPDYNVNRLIASADGGYLPYDHAIKVPLNEPYNIQATQTIEVSLFYRGSFATENGWKKIHFFDQLGTNGVRNVIAIDNGQNNNRSLASVISITTSMEQQRYIDPSFAPIAPGIYNYYDPVLNGIRPLTAIEVSTTLESLPIGTQILYRIGVDEIVSPDAPPSKQGTVDSTNYTANQMVTHQPISPRRTKFFLRVGGVGSQILIPG